MSPRVKDAQRRDQEAFREPHASEAQTSVRLEPSASSWEGRRKRQSPLRGPSASRDRGLSPTGWTARRSPSREVETLGESQRLRGLVSQKATHIPPCTLTIHPEADAVVPISQVGKLRPGALGPRSDCW